MKSPKGTLHWLNQVRAASVWGWIAWCSLASSPGAVHYVDANATNPTPPYQGWATAAANIQAAVDIAAAGDEIIVADGVYASGGRAVYGMMTNRVAVDKAVAVRSVNGPTATVIQGFSLPDSANGDGAIRCVYLAEGASLSGFTLTLGATRAGAGDVNNEQCGGGVWCASTSALVTNCMVVSNSAAYYGGGTFGGTLDHCTISSNWVKTTAALGGGAYAATLKNSLVSGNRAIGNSLWTYAGGAYGCLLINCTVTGNVAPFGGAGVASCTLHNCILTNNSGVNRGGGAFESTLHNCLLVGNTALVGGGAYSCALNSCTVSSNRGVANAGGVSGCTLSNSIVYFNTYMMGSDNNYGGADCTFNYCCTTPLPVTGLGNIDADPLFKSFSTGDFRLQTNSPCINAGLNHYSIDPFDLDQNPRIIGGTIDLGAYEAPLPKVEAFHGWLGQFALPIDGSADYLDSDGDGMNNADEWLAGTNPTNRLSALSIISVTPNPGSVTVTWSSVSNRIYTLQRSTNLALFPSFLPVRSSVPGSDGTTSLVDTNPPSARPAFYRVDVQSLP